MFSDSLVLFFL